MALHGSKAYLDKLNRRAAACIIGGRSVGADELKPTLSLPSLQARRNYLKCILVYRCLHGLAPMYLLSEFSCALRSRAPLSTKAALSGVRAYNALLWTLRQLDNFKEFKLKLKRHLKNLLHCSWGGLGTRHMGGNKGRVG